MASWLIISNQPMSTTAYTTGIAQVVDLFSQIFTDDKTKSLHKTHMAIKEHLIIIHKG